MKYSHRIIRTRIDRVGKRWRVYVIDDRLQTRYKVTIRAGAYGYGTR